MPRGVYTTFAQKYLGTYELEWMGETVDLTPGWPRLTMIEAVKKYVGIDFGAISDDAEAVAAAKAVGVELADAAEKTWGNALYACFDQKVEEQLVSRRSSPCIRSRFRRSRSAARLTRD